jgi:hypothetical protein
MPASQATANLQGIAKIVGELDTLPEFCTLPAERWIHLGPPTRSKDISHDAFESRE